MIAMTITGTAGNAAIIFAIAGIFTAIAGIAGTIAVTAVMIVGKEDMIAGTKNLKAVNERQPFTFVLRSRHGITETETV